MNVQRQPLGLKQPKAKKDPAYLQAVRDLPCCICTAFGMAQASATQAHHPIMDRFSTHKRPDSTAIPLCEGHHQGMFDTTKTAVHREPKAWRELYGADHEWIEVTQDQIGREKG